MGRRVEVPLPTGAVANEILTAARAGGMAEQDFAAVFHTLAKLSGVQP
jgi:3-hydroxyisobutyrate dehydrogenase-like beta-hydroxyacid dehydrogenase